VAEVCLKTGEIVLIDDEDLPKVAHIKWYRHGEGYAVGYIPSSSWGAKDWKLVLLHQLILPGCHKVDHRNGNRLDNHKQNLRPADDFEHARNVKVRTTATKTSRFKGVCWHKQLERWWVRVANKSCGTFDSEIQAAQAYNDAALQEFGEFAKLNIIT
jgi:hypothetical protein